MFDALTHLDKWGLVGLLLSVAASLLCITFHELSHGYVAYRLGDPTAKRAGRLTLNPVKHIDIVGLLMMIFAHVGWAKPVPVNMGYFKRPKAGMAITALAGPISNFVLAFGALAVSSGLYHFTQLGKGTLVCLSFLSNVALLSVGLGLFNLIPIPPLDGSKVVGAFLPNRVYLTVLRYERYAMLLVVFLTAAGALQKPLSQMIFHVLNALCTLTGYPLEVLLYTQDISLLAQLFF